MKINLLSRTNLLLAKYTGIKIAKANEECAPIYKSDTFLVSYPKSGNTWLRFLLSNILYPASSTNFTNVHQRIPDIHDRNPSRIYKSQKPRILKSHSCYKPEYTRVIYLVRDPRDVLVSEYYYLKRNKVAPDRFEDFYEQFLRGENHHFGSWGEHVGSWLGADQNSVRNHCLFIRYEDLKADPLSILNEILKFSGQPRSNQIIQQAIERSSFESMKEMDKNREAYFKAEKNSSIPFVRQGGEEEWREFLSNDQENRLKQTFFYSMERFNYT